MTLSDDLALGVEDIGPTVIRTQGRRSRTPTILGVRALAADEVEAHNTREAGTKAPSLQRITARHRQLARLLASGMTPSQAAHSVGLSVSRVSILQSDPSFQDLVAHCTAVRDGAFVTFTERAAALLEETVEVLHERLESEPDSFEVGDLQRQIQVLADRTGHAPKRVEEKNVNFNFGDRLAAGRERARREIAASVVEEAVVVKESVE